MRSGTYGECAFGEVAGMLRLGLLRWGYTISSPSISKEVTLP